MKMTTLTKFCIIAVATASSLLTLGLSTPAYAGPERMYDNSKDKTVMAPPPVCDPRWYFSIGGSVDYAFGDFSNGVNETFSFNPDTGTAGRSVETELDIRSRNWDDVYGDWWNVEGEIGYVLTNHIELFGKFMYTHGSGKLVDGSSVNFIINNKGTEEFDFNLVSRWDDYDSFGGELGLRYFFMDKEARIRPYVSIAGGVTYVDAIGLHVDAPALALFTSNTTVYNGAFYDDSIVAKVTGMLGVEYAVIPCKFSVGVEAGLSWQSELDGNDRGFENFFQSFNNVAAISQGGSSSQFVDALKRLNNDGSRFSVPVDVYVKFRF